MNCAKRLTGSSLFSEWGCTQLGLYYVVSDMAAKNRVLPVTKTRDLAIVWLFHNTAVLSIVELSEIVDNTKRSAWFTALDHRHYRTERCVIAHFAERVGVLFYFVVQPFYET